MTENPLGYEKIPKLLKNFAVPSIVASLVGSIYNIVDQIFIGQGVGYLGNAATNVAYPFSTICLAIALLVGIGSASHAYLSFHGVGKWCAVAFFQLFYRNRKSVKRCSVGINKADLFLDSAYPAAPASFRNYGSIASGACC